MVALCWYYYRFRITLQSHRQVIIQYSHLATVWTKQIKKLCSQHAYRFCHYTSDRSYQFNISVTAAIQDLKCTSTSNDDICTHSAGADWDGIGDWQFDKSFIICHLLGWLIDGFIDYPTGCLVIVDWLTVATDSPEMPVAETILMRK